LLCFLFLAIFPRFFLSLFFPSLSLVYLFPFLKGPVILDQPIA